MRARKAFEVDGNTDPSQDELDEAIYNLAYQELNTRSATKASKCLVSTGLQLSEHELTLRTSLESQIDAGRSEDCPGAAESKSVNIGSNTELLSCLAPSLSRERVGERSVLRHLILEAANSSTLLQMRNRSNPKVSAPLGTSMLSKNHTMHAGPRHGTDVARMQKLQVPKDRTKPKC